jgi:hypothetical protein
MKKIVPKRQIRKKRKEAKRTLKNNRYWENRSPISLFRLSKKLREILIQPKLTIIDNIKLIKETIKDNIGRDNIGKKLIISGARLIKPVKSPMAIKNQKLLFIVFQPKARA